MPRFRRLALALPALLTALLLLAWQSLGPQPVMDVRFRTLAGVEHTLSGWRGGPVLVSFWTSDCRTCLEEIPHLREIHARFAPQGMHMVAIAMSYDPPNRVVSFARAEQLPWEVALDLGGEAARVFAVMATPTTVLLDRDGRVAQRWVGRFAPAQLTAHLQTLLGK